MADPLCTFGVAGMQHHELHALVKAGLPAAVDALSVGVMEANQVELRREPDNRFDPNAVEVFGVLAKAPDGIEPHLIKFGYVPRQVALWLAKLLDSGTQVIPRVEYADLLHGSLHISITRKD